MEDSLKDKLSKWSETKDISLATDICEMIFSAYAENGRNADDVIADVALWGVEKNLTDPKAQLNKVIEEVGEMAHEITRNRYDTDEMRDSIGDTLVTIIILSYILGHDPIECLDGAYQVIKNRTGHTSNGTFVKDDQ